MFASLSDFLPAIDMTIVSEKIAVKLLLSDLIW